MNEASGNNTMLSRLKARFKKVIEEENDIAVVELDRDLELDAADIDPFSKRKPIYAPTLPSMEGEDPISIQPITLRLILDRKRASKQTWHPLMQRPVMLQLTPLLRCLQIFGYLPLRLAHGQIFKSGTWLLLAYTSLISLIAVFVLVFALVSIMSEINGQRTLTIQNTCRIIAALKPLHVMANLFAFLYYRKEHLRFLNRLDQVDQKFVRSYNFEVSTRICLRNIFVVLCLVAISTTAIKLCQYYLTDEHIEQGFFSQAAFGLIPFLSTLQILPLLYFAVVSALVCQYFRRLERALKGDSGFRLRKMSFYYADYLSLTKLCSKMGRIFNPFLFFSLVISLIILCLTIYFLSEASKMAPVDYNSEQQTLNTFMLIWSGTQVITAVFNIVVICVVGTHINEEARKITRRVVLSMVPEDDQDKFEALWFIMKTNTQHLHSWGLSVWKAFPLERPLLFTLLSCLGTYAILLLKLKQDDRSCGLKEGSVSAWINFTEYLVKKSQEL